MSGLTDEQKKFNVQLEWLKELGADLRARTQAEYLYTAAALALYGGVCWGVAALPKTGCWVAIGVAAVAVLISWKIAADHETYRTIWKARGIIINRLEPSKPPRPEDSLFPEPEHRKWLWVKWGEWLTACSANRTNLTSKLLGNVGAILAPNTPVGLRDEPGRGYVGSIIVVVATAFLAGLFCLHIAGSSCTR